MPYQILHIRNSIGHIILLRFIILVIFSWELLKFKPYECFPRKWSRDFKILFYWWHLGTSVGLWHLHLIPVTNLTVYKMHKKVYSWFSILIAWINFYLEVTIFQYLAFLIPECTAFTFNVFPSYVSFEFVIFKIFTLFWEWNSNLKSSNSYHHRLIENAEGGCDSESSNESRKRQSEFCKVEVWLMHGV